MSAFQKKQNYLVLTVIVIQRPIKVQLAYRRNDKMSDRMMNNDLASDKTISSRGFLYDAAEEMTDSHATNKTNLKIENKFE